MGLFDKMKQAAANVSGNQTVTFTFQALPESLAPVPMATWGNHEQSHVGQNYLKSLFALGFQGFLILICVAIYAVLLQNVAISGDAINSIWSIVGYTVLLCFTLFKTGSVARSILGAH